MAIGTVEEAVSTHPFFSGLESRILATLASCASSQVFRPGEYLCRESEEARSFYLIQSGQVTLELYAPSYGILSIETLQEGDIVGWSWAVAPHHWHFDARARDTVRALAFDARSLREKCELDHEIGYQLLSRVSSLIEQRLATTRRHLLDVYARGRLHSARSSH